ncbi:hypothetical protein K438DRAFT_1820883 [Mycena galopus ATCC 62051]|nr:hypothetical protein K438DRAFT_1820883 [Mycena galopus ATCC 62051]
MVHAVCIAVPPHPLPLHPHPRLHPRLHPSWQRRTHLDTRVLAVRFASDGIGSHTDNGADSDADARSLPLVVRPKLKQGSPMGGPPFPSLIVQLSFLNSTPRLCTGTGWRAVPPTQHNARDLLFLPSFEGGFVPVHTYPAGLAHSLMDGWMGFQAGLVGGVGDMQYACVPLPPRTRARYPIHNFMHMHIYIRTHAHPQPPPS